jgi:hypothetical protein
MKDNDRICVALLCNAAFFGKMLYTLNGVRSNGYAGDVCVIIGDDLKDHNALQHPLLKLPNTHIKHFNDINFDEKFLDSFEKINRPPHWREKIFQYHKLHLFDEFFKKWDFIFYVDSGAHVIGNIAPILASRSSQKFIAHSDAYHTYEWKLKNQFDDKNENYTRLLGTYDIDIDYPQTTIMLYDTKIITCDTKKDLLDLALEWNFSITNDQGIIALYFASIKKVWEQIALGDDSTWYYDFMIRDHKRHKPYLILKRM